MRDLPRPRGELGLDVFEVLREPAQRRGDQQVILWVSIGIR
nr:hypothetical protein [Halovivax sp. KZCA124]